MRDPRRLSPRIDVDALCWEVVDDRETSGIAVDLSIDGVRLERPYAGGRLARAVPLQLELPGIDEVMWARGEVVYDRVVPARCRSSGGPFGLLRRTGYRLALAAGRDMRLLRDYVMDLDGVARALRCDDDDEALSMELATCYARG
jgi:hypothetical protein